jgi:hypothetical protein
VKCLPTNHDLNSLCHLDLQSAEEKVAVEDCIMRSFITSYASPNVVRVIKSRRIWAWHIARMGKMKKAYKIFVRRPKGKRPLGRPRRERRIILNVRGYIQKSPD